MRRAWLLLLAILALTACSPVEPGASEADAVEVRGKSVLVGWDGQRAAYISTDRGRTWQETQASGETLRVQTSQCVPKDPDRCYMIAKGQMKVLESLDAGKTWRTAWEVTPGRVELLTRDLGTMPESKALAIQSSARGHVVVVANGSDGVAVRDIHGTWQRMGFGSMTMSEEEAISLDSAGHIGYEAWIAILAGVWTLMAGFAIAGRKTSLTLIAIFGLLAATISFAAAAGGSGIATLGALAVMGTLGLLITAWQTASLRGRTLGTVLSAGILVALGVLGPFRAWSMGWVDAYDSAAGVSLGLGAVFMVAGLALVYRVAKKAR